MTEQEKPLAEPEKPKGQSLREVVEAAFKMLDSLLEKMQRGDKLAGSKPSPAKRALIPIRNLLFTHEMQLAALGQALQQMSLTNQLMMEALADKGLITAADIEATAEKMGLKKVKKEEETPTPESLAIEPIQTVDSCPIPDEPDSSGS